MNFIDNTIIKFHGKSRRGSENVEIHEQILTLQNLYASYREKLIFLSEQKELLEDNDLADLKKNAHIIEEQISKLSNLID